ncbi:MAG: PAS domain S-box protein [Balneolaceae bacterium]|nr:PAS domain S-box protein [Balneolaceae bacterium]
MFKNISIQLRQIIISCVFVILAIFIVAATYYGTKTMSSIRAYITAEGLWSKAQKEATVQLMEYSSQKEEKYYNRFVEILELQKSFSNARKTLISDNPNPEVARLGFQNSELHPKDIELMIWLVLNFKEVSYVSKALEIWKEGDRQIARLDSLGHVIHREINAGEFSVAKRDSLLADIRSTDQLLTTLENAFSATLNEGARWIHDFIFWSITGLGVLLILLGYLVTVSNFRKVGNLSRELEQLSLVASKTTDLVMITDAEERITWVNSTFEELTGYQLEEIQGMKPSDFLQGPETDSETKRRLAKAIGQGQSIRERILNYSKSGEAYWLDMKIDPIYDEEGEIKNFIAIERDVSAEVEQEARLKESLERYDIVARATSDTIWDLDLERDVMVYNDVIHDMFGYSKTEIKEVQDWWQDKIHPDDRQEVEEKLEKVMKGKKDRVQFEYRFKCADGTYKYIYDRAFVVLDDEGTPVRMIGAMQDITERIKAEQLIKDALHEKETLLAEVHHRVKNNMAVVSGMMQLQAMNEENIELREKLLDNVARIGAMASIHEHLYKSENFASLNFSENLKKVTEKVMQSMAPDKEIQIKTKLEPINLNINQAIPCSLIASEVITNTLKHAFAGREQGTIQLTLKEEEGKIIMKIKDDGVGMPENIGDPDELESLGFLLINKLCEQLEGEYHYKSKGNGTEFYLSFKKTDIKGSGNAQL